MTSHSSHYIDGQWVHADLAEDYRGRIADILITEAHTNSLAGRAAAPEPAAAARPAALAEGQPA